MASRWPIERESTMRFGTSSGDGALDETGSEAFAAKGVSYAIINKLGRRYHVLTTHLQGGAPSDEGAVRAAQLIEMYVFAVNIFITGSSPDDGVIYTGDFNFDMETDPVGYNLVVSTLNAAFVDAPRPPGRTLSTQTNRWTVDPAPNTLAAQKGAGY